jgi:hypothetical protein
VVCLTTAPQPLREQVLHTVRSSASSSNLQYPLVSLSSFSSSLHLLSRLCVTSFLPSIFPSITCFRRQSLCMMRPIQLTFYLSIVCIMLLSSFTLCNTSKKSHTIEPPDLVRPSPAAHLRTSQVFPIYCTKCLQFEPHTKLYTKCNT